MNSVGVWHLYLCVFYRMCLYLTYKGWMWFIEHTHIVSVFIMHKYVPSRAGKVISDSFLRGLIRYFDGLFPVLLQNRFSLEGKKKRQVEASLFHTYSGSRYHRLRDQLCASSTGLKNPVKEERFLSSNNGFENSPQPFNPSPHTTLPQPLC